MIVTVDGIKHVLHITLKHEHGDVPFDDRIEYRINREMPQGERQDANQQLSLFDDSIPS